MDYKLVDNKVVEVVEKPVDLSFIKMELERLKLERTRIDLEIAGLQYKLDEVAKLLPKEIEDVKC